MKILYLAPDRLASHKGAAVRIERTVATLQALGHAVSLFTPAEPASLADPSLEGSVVEANFLKRMLAFRREAEAWLAGRAADLIQFRGVWEGLPAVARAQALGVPALFEAHGFPSIELPYHFPALSAHPRAIEKLIGEERRVLAGSRHVIVPSRTSARYVLRLGVDRRRISVVPNAVDGGQFPAAPVAPPDVPPLRLVYVGTLAPWQGLGCLLEALALLRSRMSVELHVIGPLKSGWRSALRRQARALRVHHLLQLSGPMLQLDLVPVLHTAHVCLAPLPADQRNALQGCCPIKLLEYMAAARPILSTRIPPVEDILEHGETAHLVRPGSATALAEGLLWMAGHPDEREAMAARARRAALARFGPLQFTERLRQALARVSG